MPDQAELSAVQANQVAVAKSQKSLVDPLAIASFLSDIKSPISFLDYETFPAAVPRFDGYRPFDQIPFQYSLDVVDGLNLKHHEFLFTDNCNPDASFVASLERHLPTTGSVVVWNKTFEISINNRLAARNPEAGPMMEALNERVVDLEDVFRQQMLVHPGFRGRTSLKSVLPTLVPDLTYENQVIQDGGTASATWNRIVTGDISADAIQRHRQDLLTYCALDTRAMVEIWRVLQRIAEQAD